jgi:Fe-S cluster assembly protein SufD
VIVALEPGSDVTLLETHVSLPGREHFENSCTEVSVGANARLEHVRVHHGAANASSYADLSVRLERDSRYASRLFTFGGALTRVDLGVAFRGPGAECELDGLYLAHAAEMVDHHTVVDHAVPRCTSRQRYRGIVDGNGAAVFDGTVFVRPGADKTAAHQENKNLLLSSDANVHTKPHLEIDTDDVKCSHGATVGRLDQNQLFYLRSRGMDATTARSLLTYAFARQVAESIADERVRAAVEDAIAERLPNGAAMKELA